MEASDRTLIISDGGLASLIACAAAHEAATLAQSAAGPDAPRRPAPRPAVVWTSGGLGAASDRALAEIADSVERQAAAYGLRSVIRLAPASVLSPVDPRWPGVAATAMLLGAACEAVAQECDRVIWPVHFGVPGHDAKRDLDRLSAAVDRALLVTRLVALDADEHARPALRIETPYVDLTDHQLADLAVDLDVPVETCGWWRPEFVPRDPASPAPAGLEEAWSQWQRWTSALRAVGWTPDPARS